LKIEICEAMKSRKGNKVASLRGAQRLQQLKIENEMCKAMKSRKDNKVASLRGAQRRSNPEKTSASLSMLWIASLRSQ
jgi:hypothetical protein